MRVSRHDLARLLASATKVVESRNTIPILGTVRLVADGQRLTVTATDLDIEVSGSIEADGSLEACVGAKLLAGVVNKACGADLDIEQADGQLTVKAGRSRFKLPTLPIDDFPSLTSGTFDVEFTTDLSALFAPVQFAISTEETRFYLNGIYLEPSAATATDGHRLSTVVTELPEFAPVIVPRKTVSILPKGDAKVSLSTTKIRIETDETVLTSKLIDGSFPDYRRVIPANNDKHVVVDKDTLAAAVGRMTTVADDRSRAVKLDIASGALELSLRSDAEATDTLEVEYSGEPVAIGFNAKYVADALSVFPAGPLNIAIADGGTPALITSPGREGLRVIVMPMRV